MIDLRFKQGIADAFPKGNRSDAGAVPQL